MALFKRKSQIDDDLGFGTQPILGDQRMMNADGSSNIRRIGLPFIRTSDTYNWLISMTWKKFLFILLIAYLLVNILFASLYVLIGIEHLKGADGITPRDHFFDAFFFSAQTISTVGYGHISPDGFLTSCLAAFESMLGLLAFALATGLLYGRFSRPTAKVVYSENMVIAPYKEIKGLMFRLANLRNNQLIEIEVQVVLSYNELTADQKKRRFYPLELERSKIGLLTMSWTVVHPIDENSPLYNKTAEELAEAEVEILVLLKAFDDTFSQTVHTRTSYKDENIIHNARFVTIFSRDDNGQLMLDLSKIGSLELLD
ncbi:inward rectifier potassium channel [Pedobacter cryoconitis]|uniref:Inward rectifier potassium channel n=1 Tax=Pedobacter cryoconitis TaxID=188932 RepID=A0A7W8YTZ1_9SPHI|nr:ion channel [Pedobacter cryoconitis]MBB5621746.1 inward rectifier potassium channel [Pedobacter cryoconitis]